MLAVHQYQPLPTSLLPDAAACCQVVFLGVFLLTRASQPAIAAAALQQKQHQQLQGATLLPPPTHGCRQATAHMLTMVEMSKPRKELGMCASCATPVGTDTHGALETEQQQQQHQQQEEEAPGAEEQTDIEAGGREATRAEGEASGSCSRSASGNSSIDDDELAPLRQAGPDSSSSPRAGGSSSSTSAMQHGGIDVVLAVDHATEYGKARPAEAAAARRQRRRHLRSSVSKLSRAVALDFGLDEATAARLSLGLGGGSMPGISLFAMPMLPAETARPDAASTALLLAHDAVSACGAAGGHHQLQRQPGTTTSHPDSSSSSMQTATQLGAQLDVAGDGELGPRLAATIRSLSRAQRSSSSIAVPAMCQQELALLGGSQTGPHAQRGSKQQQQLDSGINPLSNAIDETTSTQSATRLWRGPPGGGLMMGAVLAMKDGVRRGHGHHYTRMRSQTMSSVGGESPGEPAVDDLELALPLAPPPEVQQ